MKLFGQLRKVTPRISACISASLLLAGCVSVDSPLGPRVQRHVFLGPSVGFGINTPSGTYHSQTAQPDCGGFSGGSATGPVFGAVFDYWFQQSLTSNGLIARILVENLPSKFTADYGSVPVLNSHTGKREDVSESHIAEVTYSLINARLAYLYSIPLTPIGIEFGPSIGVATKLHLKQHLHINESVSPDVTFGDGSRDSTVYDQDPSAKSAIRFGLWVGAQYKFDVGWWIIAPYAGFDVGLTKILSTDSWSLSSIVFGVDAKYGIK